MPTINVQISNIKQKQNIITVTVTDENNRVVNRTIDRNDIDSWTGFANWLINQQPDYQLLPDKEKQLDITFHTETVIDPTSGLESTIKIVDDVIVTQKGG